MKASGQLKAENQARSDEDALSKARPHRSYPPDKGGKGGLFPRNINAPQ